jgi:hypothetical protein
MKQKRIFELFALIVAFVLFLSAGKSERTISGKVTDATTGEELIGVSIVLKGTNAGAISDVDGHYGFSIPEGRQTLVFSYIGYLTQEFVVEPHVATLHVAMKTDEVSLDEVVVVAYGVQSKYSIMSSVSTVRAQQSASKSKGSTWKRSGMPDNSIRLEVGDGDNDFLPLEAAQMAVQIDGFRVRVLMDCFFFNDKKNGLEGTFKLRLPTGATPYYFAFGETGYLNDESAGNGNKKNQGKQIPYVRYSPGDFDLSPETIKKMESRQWDDVKEARIVSKQKAARAYEETVGARIDPALMEWAGADFFTCRVFPLSQGKLHRVVLGYDLNMTEALDFREYLLTLPATTKDFRLDADLYAAPGMMPEITPAVETQKEENRLYFSFQNPKKKEYTIRYNKVDPILLSDEEQDYFAANYRIHLPEVKQGNLPEDAVFLLDVSLSSQPDKFNVWLKLMDEILTRNKDVIKRFSVLCFNMEAFWWNNYYLQNNYYNLSHFMEYANGLALEGATDLGMALAEASNPAWLKKNQPKHIFLMSDADFNWGESNKHAIKSLVREGDRIHTYKTGLPGTHAAMLDYLSKETGGFSFTVTGEEEAGLTAQSFRYRPWRIEQIEVSGVEDFMISGQPSQLYNGQKLIFAGRGKPEGTIHIRVNNGVETKDLNLDAKVSITSTLAKRVYGQLALAQLEGYGFQTEEATESYATYFRIPNAIMSFLMLESNSDYNRWGIDENDAESFVRNNRVEDVIRELLELGEAIALGNSKTDFLNWLKGLENDSELQFDPNDPFTQYIDNLPEKIFNVKLETYNYRVHLAELQTEQEKEMLANENMRFDNMLSLANARKSSYGKASALKLLSSVTERNAGDFIALRDMAIKAIEWDMGDQAYYMMRRIISNRQYEAVAYLTAAEALAKSGNIDMAIIYYYLCLNHDWDSDYGSFKEIAALQCLRFFNDIEKETAKKKSKIQLTPNTQNFIPSFRQQIEEFLDYSNLLIKEADVVIIINWNTNNTDIDLHVFEPTGEECYYGHTKTGIGGKLTIDVTQGYGPEMYVLENAAEGKYRVLLEYFSDDNTKTSSKSKVYIDFYRNWGRPDEKHSRKTVALEYNKDREDILQFNVKKTIE